MANYYFLIASFPALTVGKAPELTFKELESLLALNLTAGDMKKVRELLRPIDLYNIRAFWLGWPLDDRSSMKAKELEEALLVQEGLPSYVIEYLGRYESVAERLRYFSSLYVSMYQDAISRDQGFLLQYFQFERELHLVLTALRAKQSGKNLARELQFEDPTDPLVVEILAQKDAPDFTPPREYEEVKTLFFEYLAKPNELHQAILEYKFEKIEEMEEPQDFGIDRVLAFVAKFLIVESISLLSQEKGREQMRAYE
ncbi:MAG: DUF2764 family protein [Verrucomicrobia bacterium]|nr:DUF2764 family protein [Verrucomicrobiota bacterium]MDE3047047.1 DUF2764 family protein [Verrucomicrobiota bacterium]